MTVAENLQSNEQQTTASGKSSWLSVLVVLVMLGLAGIYLTDGIFNPENFQITEIQIHGEFENLNTNAVKGVVEKSLNGNYFSVDLNTLEEQIRKLPWVYAASLRRQWPSTLVVDVVEIVPLATWGASQWLNFTGDLVVQQQGDKKIFYDLPQLYGPSSRVQSVWKSYRRWSEKFALHGLYLEGLQLDSRNLWRLELSLGSLVKANDASSSENDGSSSRMDKESEERVSMIVDDHMSAQRIDRFIKSLNRNLIAEFRHMQSIDLRYPNGFAILWKDGGRPEQRQEEKLSDAEVLSQVKINPVASN